MPGAENGARLGTDRARAKFILCGLSGNVLEWYDFAIYGYFAAVIGQQFFPSDSPSASLLLSFSAFAVGFVSRPLGGVVFGYLGDRFGRKPALVWSTMAMAVPCTLIGLLPGWETIGIAAPVLLVALRLLQGASVGGELTGSVTYMLEQAPARRKGFYASFTVVGAIGGILLGSAVASAVTGLLSEAQLAEWGWRIPFLMGAAVGVVGFLLRRHMPEESFVPAARDAGNALVNAVRSHWNIMAVGFGVAVMIAVNFYMSFIYLATYMTRVAGLDQALSLEVNTISMVVLLGAVLAGGWASDRFGARTVLLCTSGALVLLAYPLFVLIDHADGRLALAGQIGLALLIGPYNGVFATYIGQLFPPKVRMSGFSVSYNASFALFGGTAPMVAQFLVGDVGAHGPALYAMLAAAIGFGSVMVARRFEDPAARRGLVAPGSTPALARSPD